MMKRREFLAMSSGLTLSALTAPVLALPEHPRKRLAVITTSWRYRTHAWHMAERFLAGYPLRGRWHRPNIEVVSAYVDQRPEGDLSPGRANEFGFTVYPTVAEALRCGGDKLNVDAVLLIGEHGDYPLNEYGQKQYPRYQLFFQIVDVFRKDGRTTPVFNDKHLSWKFEWAKEMVDTSKRMGFPLLAGSSLPVTWRMPSIEMPDDADIEEALVVAYGSTDIYDFHALETLQCMMERRRGGETGVLAIQSLKGEAVWAAMNAPAGSKDGWSARLFEACLSRSQTLTQGESFSHRYPTPEQMREWVKDPIAYRIEYIDGTRATMLLMNGLVTDFTFAAKLKGQSDPLSTLFYLPPNPNVTYSAALMENAEKMFMTGKAPYPVERTLLTSGMVEAALQSLAGGQKRQVTPHLSVNYRPAKESTFWCR
ncbi:MAG: hypothetical protein O3B13_20250 [Planctomycetota bacterium]|nr:hypothetical protein [Planctomycetota bacterium]